MATSTGTSGDQIALVIEAVENVVTLPHDTEYYVRASLGQLKVGSQSLSIEDDALPYNAHTTMPMACVDDPVLSLELINTNDEIIGVRRIRDWRRYLEGHNKGVLTASLYGPDVVLVNDESPTTRSSALYADGAIPPAKVGTIRVRIYLSPNYKALRERYDRLDVYVGKITDLVLDELLNDAPNVLLRLGENQGVDLPGVAQKIEGDGGWLWNHSLSFQYRGESELFISLRDPATDKEVGKAILFISQIAYDLNKTSVSGTTEREHTRLAGSVTICDDYGANVGQIVIGAELWNQAVVVERIAARYPDVIEALETRLRFDSGLMNCVTRLAEQLTAENQSDIAPPAETDSLYISGRLADCSNSLEQMKVDRNLLHAGLSSRRNVKKARHNEIVKAEAVETELVKAEARLYHIACDMAKEVHRGVLQYCESAQSTLRRCQLDLASSPRKRSQELGATAALEEQVLQYAADVQSFSQESGELKQRIYKTTALNQVPADLTELREVLKRSSALQHSIVLLNDNIRDQNEMARQSNRLNAIKLEESRYVKNPPPPVIVQRSGLNCFACCAPQTEAALREEFEYGMNTDTVPPLLTERA